MAFLSKLFHRNKEKKENEKVFKKEMETEELLPKKTVVARKMSYQVANLQGAGMREYQEDSFALVNAVDVIEMQKNGLFCVLADGMGGMKNGKMASEMAISCLKEGFLSMNRKGNLCQQLKESMQEAGEDIYARFGRKSGTTAIACMFFEENLYFASIGDSSLYLKRGSKLLQLNREQTYREHLLRKMVHNPNWDIEAAYDDPEAECLMEFLGKDDMGEPDYFSKPFHLEAGDQILLCSDGVSKVLSNQQIFECLDTAYAMEACERLEQAVLAIGLPTQDNYTAIVVTCDY